MELEALEEADMDDPGGRGPSRALRLVSLADLCALDSEEFCTDWDEREQVASLTRNTY